VPAGNFTRAYLRIPALTSTTWISDETLIKGQSSSYTLDIMVVQAWATISRTSEASKQ
jgi:hypothetical protein